MSYVNYSTAAQLNRRNRMPRKTKKTARRSTNRRTRKQTSDRISSLAAKGMANWRAKSETWRRHVRSTVSASFGLTIGQIASCLASCESQDETKGKRR